MHYKTSSLLFSLSIIIGMLGFLLHVSAEEPELQLFNYDDYAEVLKIYADDKGMVNYKELKANREQLDKFVTAIGDLDPKVYDEWTEKEKIVFLSNAYNVLILKVIIDNYPIKSSFFTSIFHPRNSIRQIPGVWDRKKFTVMGQKMTLDHIEHEILRKDFNEPRIHMAIVCASMSCAGLASEPYIGEKLDDMFDNNTRLFLEHPEKFRIDYDKKIVYLSQYFKWFGKDWIKTYGTDEKFIEHSETERAALNFISNYLDEKDRAFLTQERYDIKYLKYDWSLNEQKE